MGKRRKGYGNIRVNDQPLRCLTLFQPFLHDSPTIFTPFFKKTLSSFALSFTCCSNPAIEPKRTRLRVSGAALMKTSAVTGE
ncbi:hypothetical protein GQ457_04G005540 [Hibiscus cannabinus]